MQPIVKLAQDPLISATCWFTLHSLTQSPTMTEVKVRVETYDGCVTFWYEKSRVKNPTEVVCNRVTNQLMGLNIKEVSVTVA
jgi:hypothetical protein